MENYRQTKNFKRQKTDRNSDWEEPCNPCHSNENANHSKTFNDEYQHNSSDIAQNDVELFDDSFNHESEEYQLTNNEKRRQKRAHQYQQSEEAGESSKMKELVPYYKNILRTIEMGLPEESKDDIISNVLKEGKGFEVELACNKYSGHCIELLLTQCSKEDVWRQFMDAFSAQKIDAFANPSASHTTEAMIHFAVKKIENWSSTNVEESGGGPESDDEIFYHNWLTDLGDFVIEHLKSCLEDQYASHVACCLVRGLGGDMTGFEELVSRKSANHKKEFQEQYIGEKASGSRNLLAPTVLEEVPKWFLKLLKKITKKILNIENISEYVTYAPSLIVIEALLLTLKKRLPKYCKKLISSLSTKVFAAKNQDKVPHVFLHKNCSFLVEKIFDAADEDTKAWLWEEYFSECLEPLINHHVGNFIVQRLFDSVDNKVLFEKMMDSFGNVSQKILETRRFGIFVAAANACNRLKAQQAQFMKNIMHCLQCDEPEDRQNYIVRHLLGLKTFQQDSQLEDSQIYICLQGSLLLQALLKFQKPIKVVRSLLGMKPYEISYLAGHMQGCYVLHAFFNSVPVGEKNKDKLLQNLKPALVSMACDRNASLTLSRIWVLLTLKQKSTLLDFLNKEERNSEALQTSQNASTLLKKFGIFHFRRDHDKWKEIQNSFSKNHHTKV